MSWGFLNLTPVLGIKVVNTLLGVIYPEKGDLEATLDTGYEGFLLIPYALFERLKFNELKPIKRVLLTADHRRIETIGAYGTIIYSTVNHSNDGLIETNPTIEEILVGIKGINGLLTAINTCRKLTWITKC
jgi:predicted aspartyl protease